MPVRYPPIAPRAGEPATPTEIVPQELQSVDVDQMARLAALEARPAGFVEAHHPIRDAVTIAALKPAAEILKRHVARQRMMNAAMAAPPDSDDPDERPMGLPDDDGLPGILAMAETQVALAILGDVKAFAAIADRLEGKAGLRKADVDSETIAARERVRSTIETIVRDMADARARQAAPILDGEIVRDET